jgi:hypothetical protein
MQYLIDPQQLKNELASMEMPARGMYITYVVNAMLSGKSLPEWACKPGSASKATSAYSEAFNAFWQAYPARAGVKSGKMPAFKAWQKLLKELRTDEAQLLTRIVAALAWQRQTEQWQEAAGKYIPMPSTYLNQHRFEDEPPDSEPAQNVVAPMNWTEFE